MKMNAIQILSLIMAIFFLAGSFLYEPYSPQSYAIGIGFVIAIIVFLIGVIYNMEADKNEESA